MSKLVADKKRVTVFVNDELFASIQALAVKRAWSNGKAAEQLLKACFNGTAYSLLEDVEMVKAPRKRKMVRVG